MLPKRSLPTLNKAAGLSPEVIAVVLVLNNVGLSDSRDHAAISGRHRAVWPWGVEKLNGWCYIQWAFWVGEARNRTGTSGVLGSGVVTF